ncbi:MAG TPA: ATP-binding protein [Acidobacteriota bacterium]|jgi:two-component system sensor histidine kinase PilS (NtrC family)
MNKSTKSATELRQRLLSVVILRVIVITPVLAFAGILRTQLSVKALVAFWVAIYALSLFHFLTLRVLSNLTISFYIQMLSDLVFVTLLIHRSGDFNSIFIPLYLLVIIYSSMLEQRRGGTIATSLSIICYVTIILLGYFGWIPFPTSSQLSQEIVFRIGLNLLSFIGVGSLGIYLSERLQVVRRELGQKEDSLAELQALHKNIINSIRSGLFTTDLQGAITSFNPAAEEITHYSGPRVLGRACSVIIGHLGMRRLMSSDFTRLKHALRTEVWARDAAGRSRYFGFSASPLFSQSDQIIGYIISFQDLTGIKKLEEEVRLKDKMAAIGNLAAGIAHELRNPLGSIAGSVQVLKSDLELTGDRAQLLDIVLRESDRLNKIIEDFLSYAKPRDSMMRPVALDNVLEETLQLVRNDPKFSGHKILVDKSNSTPPCLANPDQIKQLFWNLITNAMKAMPNGGELNIRISHSDKYVKAAFKDHGIGMSRPERSRLFQPFASGFVNGVGLGMAIVYQIVQRHRGKIAVKSRKHKGTTIIVAIPLDRRVSESPASQSDVVGSGKRD